MSTTTEPGTASADTHRSYWLHAVTMNGSTIDDSITAKDDKAAKEGFAALYRLDALYSYEIQEVTKSYRTIARA